MAEPGNGKSPDPAPTFEEAYAELEQTAQALQQGQLSLDETLRLYERGSFLANYCLEKLEGVELKIVQLLAKADGTYATKQIASEKDVSPPQPVPAQPKHEPEPDLDRPSEDALKDQRALFD